MRKCPYCDEEIRDNAVKCRHCGSALTGAAHAVAAGNTLDLARTVLSGQITPGMLLAGQYRILGERPLGAGGMGEVWQARDMELGTIVAIKVLPAVLARDEAAIANLRREATIGQQLTHRSICRLYGFHSDGTARFLVMEYVDGKTLGAILGQREDRRMAWEELEPIACQIAEAMDAAHATAYTDSTGRRVRGVLHRDIKVQNIMVTHDGIAKLMDFGIAREVHNSMTQVTGRASLTPLYASPEQFRGERMTARSDIYSFAVVLYECLAGRPVVAPYGDLAWQILHREFEPLDHHPERVNAMLAAGLAKSPESRPGSARELLDLARRARAPSNAHRPRHAVADDTHRGRQAQCSACNRDLAGTDVFCPWCGARQQATKACSRCGSPVAERDGFCMACGIRLGSTQERSDLE